MMLYKALERLNHMLKSEEGNVALWTSVLVYDILSIFLHDGICILHPSTPWNFHFTIFKALSYGLLLVAITIILRNMVNRDGFSGHGNAFAAQEEGDQAMSSFRTASRSFP
ncbi:hypothetical protein IFM89_035234, partial [Coptis chinensis]